jgi:RNA polymerase sigma factor (sigma-70 family)
VSDMTPKQVQDLSLRSYRPGKDSSEVFEAYQDTIERVLIRQRSGAEEIRALKAYFDCALRRSQQWQRTQQYKREWREQLLTEWEPSLSGTDEELRLHRLPRQLASPDIETMLIEREREQEWADCITSLRKAVKKALTPYEKRVYELRFHQQLRYEDIAERFNKHRDLKVTPQAIRQTTTRIRKKLADYLRRGT